MVIRSNRCMAIALVSCMAFSQVSFAGAPAVSSTATSGSAIGTYAWYSALALAALMAYRLESKEGPCENVSYDFGALMRGNDGYMAKLKQAVAWADRYIIGQPYKSSKVKAKDGELVVGAAQEPLGVMGIAQSNIKPAIVGLGFAAFLNRLVNKENDLFKKENTLEFLAWLMLGDWALKSAKSA